MPSSINISPTTKGLIVGVLVGALLAFGLTTQIDYSSSKDSKNSSSTVSDENKPLYWVAPMDDSYRRDKPGKSPMGMDLVPVYPSDSTNSGVSNKRTPGTVMIPPNVQHNMGVKVEPVRIGTLQQTITTLGNVAYDEDSIVHIHPRVSGWVDTLFIKSQGEQVKKGQALYTLYSPELVNAQEEYVLALRRGDARLIEGAAARLKTLGLSKEVITNLEKSRRISQTVTFNAPQDGVVEALNIREGFYIEPGNTLMSIAQLDTVWVIAEVPEKYAQSITLHNNAVVTLDELAYSPEETWESHVEYIYPSLTEVTRTLKVRIPLSNERHVLKPNMFTHVSLKPELRAAALLVSRSAVIRTAQGAKVVLSDGEGNFKSVNVELGHSNNEYFEVVDGLLPGDEVVVSAQFLIDSESSKSSDFKRMAAPDHQATTTGVIKAIALPDDSTHDNDHVSNNGHAVHNTHALQNAEITIDRGAIEKWGRGPAEMTFALSKHIDVSTFKEGDSIVFTFVTGDAFTVIDMRHAEKDADHHTEHHTSDNKENGHESMNHKEHMHHD
ncbi:efflux RND transporter periplasmic adaptor subunit [Alteromonas gracilis]|uniref:efflux RND transporter periplasmic adaptor subunit n=1 Tax=Alteromonas gracilis TaxID=1479524 RepID=UPI003735A86A